MCYNYNMSTKISDTINAFTKKMSKLKNSSDNPQVLVSSENQKVQNLVTSLEEERCYKILKNYNLYKNPVNQQIEEDEENLLKAATLYEHILSLEDSLGDCNTHLKDLRLTSPLCYKNDYTKGNEFCFLRLWFLEFKSDFDYVPILSEENEKYFIEFVHKDEYEFTSYEKEILQIIKH